MEPFDLTDTDSAWFRPFVAKLTAKAAATNTTPTYYTWEEQTAAAAGGNYSTVEPARRGTAAREANDRDVSASNTLVWMRCKGVVDGQLAYDFDAGAAFLLTVRDGTSNTSNSVSSVNTVTFSGATVSNTNTAGEAVVTIPGGSNSTTNVTNTTVTYANSTFTYNNTAVTYSNTSLTFLAVNTYVNSNSTLTLAANTYFYVEGPTTALWVFDAPVKVCSHMYWCQDGVTITGDTTDLPNPLTDEYVVFRLGGTPAADWTLRSMKNAGPTQVVLLENCTGKTMTVAHQDGAGGASWKFRCEDGKDLKVRDNGQALCRYDDTSSCWRVHRWVPAYADLQGVPVPIDALDGLTPSANTIPYFNSNTTAALTGFTSAARDLLDDADSATMRTTLGLGSIATQASNNVAITGGTINNVTLANVTFPVTVTVPYGVGAYYKTAWIIPTFDSLNALTSSMGLLSTGAAGTQSAQADARGAWCGFASTASANNDAGLSSGTNSVHLAEQPVATFVVEFPNASDIATNSRCWVGFSSNNSTLKGADTLNTLTGLAFRLSSTAGDTKWQIAYNDGTNTAPSVQDSGVTVSANTVYRLTIDASDTANIKFSVNGVVKYTATANLPASTTRMAHIANNRTLAASAKNIYLSSYRLDAAT